METNNTLTPTISEKDERTVFFINWDISGIEIENVLTATCFFTNKNYKCKNDTGVLCASEPHNHVMHSSIEIMQKTGVNHKNEPCLTIFIKNYELPIYVKEVDIFIHCANYDSEYFFNAFQRTDFFNVFKLNEHLSKNKHLSNENLIYSLTSEKTDEYVETYIDQETKASQQKILNANNVLGALLLGKLIRVGDRFIFSPKFEFINEDIQKIGQKYNINFAIS